MSLSFHEYDALLYDISFNGQTYYISEIYIPKLNLCINFINNKINVNNINRMSEARNIENIKLSNSFVDNILAINELRQKLIISEQDIEKKFLKILSRR